MATVTSNPGSVQPDSIFFDVDVDVVTTANATTYSWYQETSTGSGVAKHAFTLLGSFTYPGGVPTGDVAQILIDTDADGDTDLTIAFSTLVSGLMTELLSGNRDNFFGAAFFQDDTITLASGARFSTHEFFLGGNRPESNDNITITGRGEYGADRRSAGNTGVGGNDTITVDSPSNVQISGDFRNAGSGSIGGNDTISDISAAGSGTLTAYGDSDFGGLQGGDDIMSGTNRTVLMSGDVGSLSDGSDLAGGNDSLTGGSQNDSLYGDYRGEFLEVSENATVVGGDDTIIGGAGDDLIYGDGPEESDGIRSPLKILITGLKGP